MVLVNLKVIYKRSQYYVSYLSDRKLSHREKRWTKGQIADWWQR